MSNETALLRHPEKAHRPDTPFLRKPAGIRAEVPKPEMMHESVLAACGRTLHF